MKQLNVKLTSEQYSRIKQAAEAVRPRCSLQAWASEQLGYAAGVQLRTFDKHQNTERNQ